MRTIPHGAPFKKGQWGGSKLESGLTGTSVATERTRIRAITKKKRGTIRRKKHNCSSGLFKGVHPAVKRGGKGGMADDKTDVIQTSGGLKG